MITAYIGSRVGGQPWVKVNSCHSRTTATRLQFSHIASSSNMEQIGGMPCTASREGADARGLFFADVPKQCNEATIVWIKRAHRFVIDLCVFRFLPSSARCSYPTIYRHSPYPSSGLLATCCATRSWGSGKCQGTINGSKNLLFGFYP